MSSKSSVSAVLFISSLLVACHSSKNFVGNISKQEVRLAEQRLGMDISKHDDVALMVESSRWLGVPYKFGGLSRDGLDCSGLTTVIYYNVYNTKLHRKSIDQFNLDSRHIKRQKLKSGDLVFFSITQSGKAIDHVGVYLKDDKFIHASTSKGVIVNNLDEQYYTSHWVSGGRVKH